MIGRSEAPWTDDEVASLNGYQAHGMFHPFTHCTEDGIVVDLIATNLGWVTEIGKAPVQVWAHQFMVDWSWKTHADQMKKRFGGVDESL